MKHKTSCEVSVTQGLLYFHCSQQDHRAERPMPARVLHDVCTHRRQRRRVREGRLGQYVHAEVHLARGGCDVTVVVSVDMATVTAAAL
jgi:hypothetical protein